MAKMPTYAELTGGKTRQSSGSMPSYSDLVKKREEKDRSIQAGLVRQASSARSRINNWFDSDDKDDISSDIRSYELAIDALKRYGKDTKAASEWIAGVRADNNVAVRQNLIDDIGEAKDSRKGTAGQYLLRSLASAVAGMQGDTEGMRTAQQEAASIAAQRKTSKQQQRDAEAALSAHREQYGNVLTAGERLEQAYKDEDEAIRSLAAIRNSNRPGSSAKSRQAEAEKKLEEAQKTIIELGGTIDASAARGAVKSYVGSAGAGVAYGLKGQDTRKQDSNIAAGIDALSTALEDAVMRGDRQEEQRLRSMVDAINQPGADKATILAEFLPGIAEVTDEAALRDRRADLQRQALGNKGYAAFKELYESGNAELEASKVGKSEAEKVLIDVAVQGGNMAADAAIGLVTGGAATPMALRTYGAGVIAAESAGASQKDAMLYGIASAGVELLSEKLFDGLAGVYGGGKADEAVDYFIGKMAKTKTGRAAWNLLFSAGGESVEELISGIADPILTSIYNDRGVFENLSEMEAADVLYDMLIGGIMGFLGGSVEGLTKRQDDASKFFQTAAEKGLTYKQASQIWAETSEVNVERDVAEIMGKAESAALKAENEAKRKEAAEKAEQAEYEYYEKLTHRAQANKVLDNDERMAEFQKRTGVELKGGKGDQARAVMAAAAEKVQEIDQKRDQRRKDDEADRAKAAVAELDTGDVALNEKGETVVDGKVVDMSVKDTLVKVGFSEARAEDIAKQYDPNTATKGEFAKAMRSTYLMARAAVPEGEINAFVDKATTQQRQIAAAYGEADRVNAAKAAQEAVKAKVGDTVVRGEGGIINDTGRSIDLDTLDAPRKAGYQMAQALAKAVGNNVHLFESVERGGKRVLAHDVGPYKAGDDAPNGWYDHSTGDIYVDINAGERGQGTILYTLSHEYTHFVRQWSPKKFETLAKFLFENADISIEAAIQQQMDKAARVGRDIDRDKAMEEVVADAMESMLSDTNAAEKILELRNRDKGLWEKLKELITKIRNAVRAAYKDFAPDSHEGLMLKRMDESLTEKLSTLFAEGVADAAENYSRANVTIDMATESVAPSNSLRRWTKSEYVQEREETAKKISKTLGVSMEKAYEYIDSINSVAKLIADDAVRLDYEPNLNESATALKPNSEYKYTVDMSTLCAKRLLFTGTFDAIQKALPNVAFDSDAIVHLRKMMMDRDYQVACGICYVESTRREIGTITKEFIERYKIAQQSGKPITRLNSEGKEVELQEKGTKRTFMAEEGYTPTLGELNTTDIDIVQRDHPDVYAAYLSFMNARGQAKPKLLETRTEYKGEILKSFNNKKAVASRNAAGGLRLQSFSDFEVPHLIDMMQVVMDMSRVGLMSQAYTKVPAFARAFGETGVKINLSLIAKDDGIDADGNLIFDDVEGINHEEAFAIREQHSKNVGTILVGKNNAHIIAAMADPRIDFIIPFHKSSWKESLYGALGLTGYQDYTATQNERPNDPNRKISNFAPSEYWDYSKTGEENAQIYLQKCREDDRIPKFPEFQTYPGYWKLLIDFKMYDNDGAGAPQQVVQPVFDDAVNAEILAEYKGGHQSYPVAQDVVDDFVREYKEGKVGGISPSLRNQPTTDRYVLTNAEGLNDTETRILARYREEYGVLVGLEETLEAQRETLKELRGSEIKDKDVLRAQREAIMATENRINIQQGILSRMEDSATLQRVLKREREIEIFEGYERGRFDQGYETAPQIRREMDAKATEEYRKGYERGRFDQGIKMAEEQRKAMEYAEKKTGQKVNRLEQRLAAAEAEEKRRVQQLKDYRQNASRKELLRKIGKTTDTLKKWLKHPDPKDHVPSDLMNVVVEALDAVNMDTVNAYERLSIIDRRIAEVDKALSVTTEYANRKRLEDEKAKLVRQQGIINRQGYKMRENLSELQSVYNEIRNSNNSVLAGSYDENISAKIQEVWEYVGDTSLRDMRVDQLQMVYDLYRMVIKSVRNANKAFRAAKNATIEELANDVRGELSEKKQRGEVRKFRQVFEKMAWTVLKPIYAFKTIGSKTMTELFNSVRAGEDTWAKDVSEALEFYLEETSKHNANRWDMEKKYSFTSTSGLNFELTLSDIMSIYAYSKREQALDHLAKGGIVLEKPDHKAKLWEKVSENATAYNLSPEILAEITGKLTTEQKAFVDAMQNYLSSVMGSKGNEVTEALYDVKLFTEENYFPLRSSKAYMARAKEQQTGEVKIKNSGFTKATTPNASNPIVLQPFMEVWSEHVSDMAMYHAFTLPLEDFYRVYNFKTGTDENNAVQSVNADIQNIYGKAAIDYIDTLLRDINGGARGDSTLAVAAKNFSKFKKAAVMASLSVVVQQPSAIARAFAYIPTHYFIGQRVNAETHDRVLDEMKKYAPVAVIKEMGAFDMNVGKRTADYITQKEYNGLGEKLKGFFTDSDYRDEAFGYLAGKADEITWIGIWNAAKRMAADTTDLHGEALLQKAGEIFTEAIVNTQVYDSVMSRSQLMRSKNGMAQMLTAFMGEPTTTLNMLYDAVLSAQRGEKKFSSRIISSVVASVLLNSALVSFVKAARDDDEDESYWEKWTSSFIGATIDGINPIDMIPYVRDLHSIIKGYDVERSDVSVFSDLVQAAQKVMNADEDEAFDAYLDFAGNVLNFVGIPGTNIIRETRAAYNFVDTLDRKTTAAGMKVAALEGLGFKKRSDARQLYDALLAGDTEHAERVMARYETEKEAYTDLRKYLREADPRIKEAAQARFAGDVAEYDAIINDIVDDGKIDRDVIVGAVRAEEDKLKDSVPGETKISSLYAQSDLVEAISDGEYGLALRIKDDIVSTAVANGKTKAEAERQFKTNAQNAAKTAYMDGKIQKSTATSLLKNYSGKSGEDSKDIISAWDFEKKNGWIYSQRGTEFKDGNITRSQLKAAMTTYGGMKSDEAELAIKVYEWEMDGFERASDAMIKKYEAGGLAAAGISKDIWYKAYTGYNDTKGVDADGDGKTDAYSKVKGAMEKINALPITAEQKTLIAMQIWESKTTINNYKLW